jgi:hypothetical protein
MKRLAWLLLGLGLVACGHKDPPPPSSLVMPGSRLLYNNGTESVWTLCDKGTRVYISNKGGVVLAPGACADGLP